MRTVVVGASSGLGRCIGIGLAQARRARRPARSAARTSRSRGEGSRRRRRSRSSATSPTRRRAAAAIAAAAAALGGIDALVYAPGIGPLARLADTDADTWRRVFDTNVTGAALVTSAALGELTKSGGTAAYLSSVERVAHTAVARARRVRGEQGRPRQAGGGLARGAPARRLHPRASSATAAAAKATRSRSSPPAGTWSSRRECPPSGSARNYLSGSLIDVDHLVTRDRRGAQRRCDALDPVDHRRAPPGPRPS